MSGADQDQPWCCWRWLERPSTASDEKDTHIENLNAKIKVLEERMVKMMTSQSDYLKAVLKAQFDDKDADL